MCWEIYLDFKLNADRQITTLVGEGGKRERGNERERLGEGEGGDSEEKRGVRIQREWERERVRESESERERECLREKREYEKNCWTIYENFAHKEMKFDKQVVFRRKIGILSKMIFINQQLN